MGIHLTAAQILASPQGILDAVESVSRGAATTLVTAIWQGAVIAACLALCLRLAPRTTAALRFAIWTAGFLLVAGLPFLPLLLKAPATAGAVSLSKTAQPWLQLDIRWSFAIAGIWAAVSIYRAVDLAIHSIRLRKLWKSAIPVETAEGLAARLPLQPGRRAELCTTRELERPSVIGFFAPRILIPEWLMARLTPEELDQIVLHESEHLRRGDDWTNLVQKLGLVLFPLNPVLLWMEHHLCLEREMACDDGVVRVTRAPRAYAACLTTLAERALNHRTEALSLGAWHRRPELVHRVHSLLTRPRRLGPVATRSLAAALGCSMVVGAIALARCPQLVAFQAAQETQAAKLEVAAVPAAPLLQETADSATRRQMPVRAFAARFRVPPSDSHARFDGNEDLGGKTAAGKAARVTTNFQPEQVNMVAALQQPNPEQAQAQGWIVLTAWEQEEAPAVNSDLSTVNSKDDSSGQVMYRTTVTRLVFRVLPANSVSRTPVAVPTRSGWLVLQL